MSKVEFKIPFGVKVKDKHTGFSGTVIGRVHMINGCVQYSVQPVMKKDDSIFIPEAYSIDEQSLEVTEGEIGKPEVVNFAYETGDKVSHRINGFEGHITHCIQDINKCERYIIEGVMREGKEVKVHAFAQELKLIDKGINAKDEEPVKRARTGGPSTRIPAQKAW